MMDRCGNETVDVFEALNLSGLLSLQLQIGAPIDFQQGSIKELNSKLAMCNILSGKKIREHA